MRFYVETLNMGDRLLESAGHSNTISAEWLEWYNGTHIITNLETVCNSEFRRIDRFRLAMVNLPQYKTEEGARHAQDKIDLAISHIERADRLIEGLTWWAEWHKARVK